MCETCRAGTTGHVQPVAGSMQGTPLTAEGGRAFLPYPSSYCSLQSTSIFLFCTCGFCNSRDHLCRVKGGRWEKPAGLLQAAGFDLDDFIVLPVGALQAEIACVL